MPFFAIHGTYHLTNRTRNGAPSGFEPDGDGIHFKAADPAMMTRLKQIGRPLVLTNIGSVMLRLESIDALELHYTVQGGGVSHQPRPLADQSRDFLTGLLGLNPVVYAPPRNVRVRVDPPPARDAAPGYIIARALEINGRPVSFAFAGPSPFADGEQVFLTPALLRPSLNYQLLRAGMAYPLFYDTLFVDLRNALRDTVRAARRAGRGLWAHDKTMTGLPVAAQLDLEEHGVLFPKLFRRLSAFFGDDAAGPPVLANFPTWLQRTEERLLDLPALNFTGFDNVVEVVPEGVRITRRPEEIIFISAK